MRALYFHPTESHLEELINEVEQSHGGKIDFPEFIEILVSVPPPIRHYFPPSMYPTVY